MPHIQLAYFALLREQAHTDSEHLDTDTTSLTALYGQLQDRHGFTLPASVLRVAVNDRFCSWDQPLHDGDSVVFIPPVNGG
jgi:molybdopterin converting factor small subunit